MASIRIGNSTRGWWGRAMLLLSAMISFFAPLARAAATWHLIETPRFTIVSQLSEKETRAWADEFDQYIEALKEIVRVDDRLLPRLTVVFFARDKTFKPYLPLRPDGKPWPVAAYFSRRETWSVIGMAEGYEEEDTRRTIFHEGVHWLVSAFTGYEPPLWLNEGLAEVFSTFTIQKHKARWGDPIAAHIYELRTETPMPLGRLLSVESDNPLFNEDNRVNIFYAESWAFVHYLLFGQKKGEHATFKEFMEATSAGLSPDQAFRKCFGVDSDGMDKQLNRYLQNGSYYVGSTALTDAGKTLAPFAVAAPEFVEVALARLALASGRNELARKHADAAVALAPQSPGGYEMQAAVRHVSEDSAGALAACKKAEELGTKDAWTYFILAYHRWDAATALGSVSPAEARAVANLYEKAINMYPNFRYAFLSLAAVLGMVEKISEHDDKFLLLGREKFPEEAMLLVGLAELARKRDKKDEAQNLLADALVHHVGRDALKPSEVERIKRLQVEWTFADSWTVAEKLAHDHKYAEALAVYDELEKQPLPIDLRSQATMRHRTLEPYMKVEKAEKALASGDKDEARRLYAEVLEMPAVNTGMRRHAQDALRRLEGKRPAVIRPPTPTPKEPTAAPALAPAEGEAGK